jgi:hypothetical protein
MGAWSHEPFGNDIACDWSYTLVESKDTAPIESALDFVLESGEEYLEADRACEAIAAVEVLTKLLGRGTQTDAYTAKVDLWVKSRAQSPSSALLMKAAAALERIVGPDSELQELWEESDDSYAWKQSVAALYHACGGATK